MARYLDLMLCIFPFEKALYEESGLRTVFVGHPMLDSLAAKRVEGARDPTLVGLFPGSRKKEVRKIFPVMVEAAEAHARSRERPAVRSIRRFPPTRRPHARHPPQHGENEDFCAVTVRSSHELMQRAIAGMVCSGTATLEAAFFGLPLCIVYKVAWLTWIVGKQLVKVPFLGMPNVLAGSGNRAGIPSGRRYAEALAEETLRLVTDTRARRPCNASCDGDRGSWRARRRRTGRGGILEELSQ